MKETTGDYAQPEEDLLAAEKSQLNKILKLIHAAIGNAAALAGSTEESYQDVKTYMTENRGEIDPSEAFQNELFLQRVDQQSAQAALSKERLEKLLDSPYFARISFLQDGGEEPLPVYIGRFAFNYQNRTLISDWRSPIASLFYDFDPGPAFYEAPSETITGQLQGKRQFKIEQGTMIYALESASSVRDEILQQELSQTSDKKMRSIISSIQKEQNKIIRDESAGTLIIQGVAGSGKTSIALHRVAYLLYRRKEHLSSQSVAILSPNRVFSDYISNVLPELGEEPIAELCLEDLYGKVLGDAVAVEPAHSFVDSTDQAWRERAHYKGSFEFMRDIVVYLEEAPKNIFTAKPLTFGRHTIEASWLEERFYGYENLPINERLTMLVSDIVLELSSKIFSLGVSGMPTRGAIKNELKKMLTAKNALALYRQFYKDGNRKKLFTLPAKNTVEWEDACALALFQGAYERLDGYMNIEHLVIDEMQDLTPIQHLMIQSFFKCDKTILGDYYQLIDPENHMNLGSMKSIYESARIVELKKSYRSTLEITELAKKVKAIPDLESVERHGEEPTLQSCKDSLEVLGHLDVLIKDFQNSEHKTLGIFHKSEDLAHRYYELLARDHDVNLLSPESTTFEEGISVCPIKMAKGLEFDEAIILDADSTQYTTDDDRNLLYVAITRAMHKLSILYRKEPTEFIS